MLCPRKLWTGSLVSWKTAEGLAPETRARAPGYPLRSGESKRAGFSLELMVSNLQETVYKLSGAVHGCRESVTGSSKLERNNKVAGTVVWAGCVNGLRLDPTGLSKTMMEYRACSGQCIYSRVASTDRQRPSAWRGCVIIPHFNREGERVTVA